jgi:O-glycosyl hydrolase
VSIVWLFWMMGLVSSVHVPDVHAQSVAVDVDASERHQTIEGFGATTLSLVYGTDNLTPALRARAIEMIYGEVGLTMGNLQSGWPESPANDNDDAFDLNPGGFDWSGSNVIKQKIVDPAAAYGFDNFFLAPTINLRWEMPWLKSIRDGGDTDRYLDEAAEHVLAELLYWRDAFGIRPRYVSLFNEPLGGNSELDGGTAGEVVQIVRRVGARLAANGFDDIGIVVPNAETVEETLDLARLLLQDSEARRYISAIGYHIYPYGSDYSSVARILEDSGSGNPSASQVAYRAQLRELAGLFNVQLWMTEASMGPGVERKDFPFGAVENLRARAIHIHDELVYADASAFFGMNNMWDLKAHRAHFNGSDDFLTEQSTILLIDDETGELFISGMGYAIGHYARWLPRGAVRIGSSSSDPLVQVTAFRDERNSRIVLVLINNRSGSASVDLDIVAAETGGILTGEVSDANRRWSALDGIALSADASISLQLPAESVTTVAIPVVAFTSAEPTERPLDGSAGAMIYPNPIASTGTIRFELASAQHVRLRISDPLGREVLSLVDEMLSAGEHVRVLDGSELGAGVYVCELRLRDRVVSGLFVKL